jgi:tripartite-type tricarboxylate transporter receptor subunit TctC
VKLHDAFNKVSVIPDVREKRIVVGSTLPDLNLTELRPYIKNTVDTWKTMAREADVKLAPQLSASLS